MILHSITAVRPKNDYKLLITFDTGETLEYDASDLVTKGVFQELQDTKKFNQVFINPESKTVTWKNGLDLCPDALYQEVAEYNKK